MEASMIAVSGSAHAIDALYGTIREQIAVPPELSESWERNRTARRDRILETLKLGFDLGNVTGWVAEFEWLFGLRDAAVHHEAEFGESVPHPSGRTNVVKEGADYSVESARRAIDLALDVLARCLTRPKRELTVWASKHEPIVETLREWSQSDAPPPF